LAFGGELLLWLTPTGAPQQRLRFGERLAGRAEQRLHQSADRRIEVDGRHDGGHETDAGGLGGGHGPAGGADLERQLKPGADRVALDRRHRDDLRPAEPGEPLLKRFDRPVALDDRGAGDIPGPGIPRG
jgi:hypothetical protein